MNIFEALSQGKERINEENTSSFLAYLLKDNESHGLKREFFNRFIKLSKLDIANTVDYNVTVKLEYKTVKKRIIDILLVLYDAEMEGNRIKYVIGIENKITPHSCQSKQLSEEIMGLENDSNYKNATKYMVFLVPDSDSKQVKSEYEYAIQRNKNISLVLWSDITKEIKSMLDDENEAKIIPMSYYLKQTLKAFYYYINHLTDIKIRKKVEVTYKKYPQCCYDLIMLSDGRMRIRSKNQSDDDVEEGLIPKHMIYDVLFALGQKSNIQTRYGKGIDGTPRILGAEMFGILEKKRLAKIEITDNSPCFSPYNTRAGSNIF